jgi:hypothetical protein
MPAAPGTARSRCSPTRRPVRQYASALAALDRIAPADEAARCEILIALASAQNQAGETAAGKSTALRAAESARRRGARDQLRRAALAFSPRLFWGDTNDTDPAEVALLEEALAGHDGDDSPLQVKLLARLATALYYQADAQARRTEASERAVAMARRLGDGPTLAYALYSRHLTMWVPGNAEERFAVATELVRLADAAGDTQMGFNGRFARFSDHLELGNAAALAVELEACRRLSNHRDPYQRLHILGIRAARALIPGRWDEATSLLEEFQELYRVWPHNDVPTAIGFLLWGVAMHRGGTASLVPGMQIGAAAIPGVPLPRCILAAAYAGAGRLDEARREYDAFVPDGLAGLNHELSFALSLSQLAETCRHLDDERGAEALYATLLPYAKTCVAAGGLGFYGAVDLYLGILATMRRWWDDAAAHFEHAMILHERMDAAPWLARTRYEYAVMLVRRAQSGDVERAQTLLEGARELAAILSMDVLRAKVDDLAAKVGTPAPISAPAPVAPARPVASANVFRREGEYWTIAYGGAAVRLHDTKGLHYIAYLLAPRRPRYPRRRSRDALRPGRR